LSDLANAFWTNGHKQETMCLVAKITITLETLGTSHIAQRVLGDWPDERTWAFERMLKASSIESPKYK
jgi:hypothetical protein